MSSQKSIGIGGVMAEVAWIGGKNRSLVDEQSLIVNLCKRYAVDVATAKVSIDIAERCGVIDRSEGGIKVKSRPY